MKTGPRSVRCSKNGTCNAIGLLRLEIDTFLLLVYLQSVDDVTASVLINDFLKGSRWRCRTGLKGAFCTRS